MADDQRIAALSKKLKECLGREEDVLFAYVYGSTVHEPEISGADIDVAAYLKALDTKGYLRRAEELTALLVSDRALADLNNAGSAVAMSSPSEEQIARWSASRVFRGRLNIPIQSLASL